jgi:hypothetical protein
MFVTPEVLQLATMKITTVYTGTRVTTFQRNPLTSPSIQQAPLQYHNTPYLTTLRHNPEYDYPKRFPCPNLQGRITR